MMRLAVRYVNGQVIETTVDGWPLLRADGIDYVDLVAERTGYRMQGCSAYWLRQEGGLWMLGGGTVVDVQEVVASPDGFDVRRPEHMPDIAHGNVKLGWWE
jgi:hypothetical protein